TNCDPAPKASRGAATPPIGNGTPTTSPYCLSKAPRIGNATASTSRSCSNTTGNSGTSTTPPTEKPSNPALQPRQTSSTGNGTPETQFCATGRREVTTNNSPPTPKSFATATIGS